MNIRSLSKPKCRVRPANRQACKFEVLCSEAYIRSMVKMLNQEAVNDAAKLIMHRLVARRLARDSSLIDRAKTSQASISMQFPSMTFVHEWDDLLALPAETLRGLLTSRNAAMKRLRLSSPFVTTEGVDFTDPDLRRRIRRAAKRIVERGIRSESDATAA